MARKKKTNSNEELLQKPEIVEKNPKKKIRTQPTEYIYKNRTNEEEKR